MLRLRADADAGAAEQGAGRRRRRHVGEAQMRLARCGKRSSHSRRQTARRRRRHWRSCGRSSGSDSIAATPDARAPPVRATGRSRCSTAVARDEFVGVVLRDRQASAAGTWRRSAPAAGRATCRPCAGGGRDRAPRHASAAPRHTLPAGPDDRTRPGMPHRSAAPTGVRPCRRTARICRRNRARRAARCRGIEMVVERHHQVGRAQSRRRTDDRKRPDRTAASTGSIAPSPNS